MAAHREAKLPQAAGVPRVTLIRSPTARLASVVRPPAERLSPLMSSRLPLDAGPPTADRTVSPASRATPAAAPSSGRLSQAMRTQLMVLFFYLLDALLMGAYALHGTLPAIAPWAFGAAGGVLTGLSALVVRMGWHRRMGGARFTTLQVLSACVLMLITAAVLPQIGTLLLLTLVVALATAALQLPLRHALSVSGLVAAVAMGLLLLHGNRLALPLDDAWLRLLAALWFAVVLAKIAAINLIGAQMRNALTASNAQLAAALKQVREMSEKDELTGLHNRRSILAQFTEERARFARGGLAFGVAMLDIDHFKQVNDRFGHAKGDEVLRVFARVAAGRLRSTDRIARFGGEEFLVLLINTPEEPAVKQAVERLRHAVEQHDWSDVGADVKVTCSIGVTMSRAGESAADMLERADAALYRAKSGGRNTVRVG
jgi:diguanylate cyclase